MSTQSWHSKNLVFVRGTEVDNALPDYWGSTAVVRRPDTDPRDAIAVALMGRVYTMGEQSFSREELTEILSLFAEEQNADPDPRLDTQHITRLNTNSGAQDF